MLPSDGRTIISMQTTRDYKLTSLQTRLYLLDYFRVNGCQLTTLSITKLRKTISLSAWIAHVESKFSPKSA